MCQAHESFESSSSHKTPGSTVTSGHKRIDGALLIEWPSLLSLHYVARHLAARLTIDSKRNASLIDEDFAKN